MSDLFNYNYDNQVKVRANALKVNEIQLKNEAGEYQKVTHGGGGGSVNLPHYTKPSTIDFIDVDGSTKIDPNNVETRNVRVAITDLATINTTITDQKIEMKDGSNTIRLNRDGLHYKEGSNPESSAYIDRIIEVANQSYIQPDEIKFDSDITNVVRLNKDGFYHQNGRFDETSAKIDDIIDVTNRWKDVQTDKDADEIDALFTKIENMNPVDPVVLPDYIKTGPDKIDFGNNKAISEADIKHPVIFSMPVTSYSGGLPNTSRLEYGKLVIHGEATTRYSRFEWDKMIARNGSTNLIINYSDIHSTVNRWKDVRPDLVTAEDINTLLNKIDDITPVDPVVLPSYLLTNPDKIDFGSGKFMLDENKLQLKIGDNEKVILDENKLKLGDVSITPGSVGAIKHPTSIQVVGKNGSNVDINSALGWSNTDGSYLHVRVGNVSTGAYAFLYQDRLKFKPIGPIDPEDENPTPTVYYTDINDVVNKWKDVQTTKDAAAINALFTKIENMTPTNLPTYLKTDEITLLPTQSIRATNVGGNATYMTISGSGIRHNSSIKVSTTSPGYATELTTAGVEFLSPDEEIISRVNRDRITFGDNLTKTITYDDIYDMVRGKTYQHISTQGGPNSIEDKAAGPGSSVLTFKEKHAGSKFIVKMVGYAERPANAQYEFRIAKGFFSRVSYIENTGGVAKNLYVTSLQSGVATSEYDRHRFLITSPEGNEAINMSSGHLIIEIFDKLSNYDSFTP